MTTADDRSRARRNRRFRLPEIRLPMEEWALVAVATGILVLPGLLGDRRAAPLRHVAGGLEPLAIDVDRAPWHEWTLIPGIGEKRARRIVDFVRTRAPIEDLETLREIRGMPSDWIERARPWLRIGSQEPGASVQDRGRGDGPGEASR